MYKNEKRWVRATLTRKLNGETDEAETEAWLRISDIVGVSVVNGKTFALMSSGREFQIHARVEDVIDSGF